MNSMSFFKAIAVVIALSAAIVINGRAEAQQNVVLVFNHQIIQAQSSAMADIRAQAQEAQAKLNEELEGKKAELETLGQELRRQMATLDPAAQEQKRREFDAQVQEAQRAADNRKRDIQIALGKAKQEVDLELQKILKQIVEEKKATLVFAKGQVVYADPALDVTQAMVERLNAVKPTATVKFP